MKLAEYIKGQPLKFKEELTGQKAGENFLVLYAYDHDDVVGTVEYSTYREDLAIKMIRTRQESDKRKGIATEMAKELQRRYPNHEVIWGTTTGEGHQFLKALPRTFLRNEKYDDLEARLKALQAQQTKLQTIYDNWSSLHDTNKEKADQLRPAVLKLNDTFNSVSDKIWEIEQELHTMKPGKWQINEGFETSDEWRNNWLERHQAQLDSSGRVMAYHGTPTKNLTSIKQHGFRPRTYFSLNPNYSKQIASTYHSTPEHKITVLKVFLPLEAIDFVASDIFSTRNIPFKETQ